MDRGAWQSVAHGIAKIRHDLVMKSTLQETRLEFIKGHKIQYDQNISLKNIKC